jgi:hypothetical protein
MVASGSSTATPRHQVVASWGTSDALEYFVEATNTFENFFKPSEPADVLD